MLVAILLIVFVSWVIVMRWEKRGMFKLWSQLKNDLTMYPIIGHAYLFLGTDEDRMKVFQKFGMEAYKTQGLFALWQGSRLYVNISDPELAEPVLKHCLEKDDVLKVSRRLTGNGSVFASVPIWRPRRKFVAPTFSPKNLAQFNQIFARQSSVMVDQLRPAAGGKAFSIWKYITTYSMDSVCESTLGIKADTQRQPEQPFLLAFEELCKLDAARFCQPWLHNEAVYSLTASGRRHDVCRAQLCGFIDQIIKEKRQSMAEEKAKQPESDQHSCKQMKTFLELLIESSAAAGGFSDLELREETLVLVLAGTDTSAVGTAFTALMLAGNQRVQDKVYQELEEVFGESERPVTASDLPHLRYLDAVVRESLRLYPPVPVIVRKVLQDLTLPTGHVLSKNCGVLINMWAIHRNPQYWGADAAEFRPERWAELALKHPAAFMPFSYGPRGCIGYRYAMMSMKTALATLLRRYRLQPARAPRAAADTPLRTKFDVMMKHVDNFQLRLELRDGGNKLTSTCDGTSNSL